MHIYTVFAQVDPQLRATWTSLPIFLLGVGNFLILISIQIVKRLSLRRSFNMPSIPSPHLVEKNIYVISGHKVMMSFYLAQLYSAETKVLS